MVSVTFKSQTSLNQIAIRKSVIFYSSPYYGNHVHKFFISFTTFGLNLINVFIPLFNINTNINLLGIKLYFNKYKNMFMSPLYLCRL